MDLQLPMWSLNLGALSSRDNGEPGLGEPTNLDAGAQLLSGRLRCAGRSRVTLTFQHKSREPSYRPPAQGPTANQVTYPPAQTLFGSHVMRGVPQRGLSGSVAFWLLGLSRRTALLPPLLLLQHRCGPRGPKSHSSSSTGTSLVSPAPKRRSSADSNSAPPGDHALPGSNPLAVPRTLSPFPVQGPLGTFLVPSRADVS